MLKNRKLISAFAVVGFLLLSISAPAFSAPPVRVSCASGGKCAVGDIGPGCGIVYYFNRKGFNCGPSLGIIRCHYLEVAPNTWSGDSADPMRSWATETNQSAAVEGADGTAIGTGLQNSIDISAQSGNVAATSAAVAALAYTVGIISDWYLPSKDELNLAYQWRTKSRVPVGGFVAGNYWSSSETNAYGAWVQSFYNGTQNATSKNSTYYVRPVRAF
jgi:hypothetical protein